MTAHAVQRSAAENTILSQFEAEAALSRSPSRAAAFKRFAEQGLPTRRVESWHYTDLRAAMRDAAPLAAAPDPATIASGRQFLADHGAVGKGRLVLLNGRPIPELCDCLPVGVSIGHEKLSRQDAEDPMAALNEAMSIEPLTLAVADGARISAPIEIVHLAICSGPASLYSRLSLVLGVGASASFIETFLGAGPAVQRNASTILTLAESANAKHIVAVLDDPELHVENQIVQIEGGASLNAFALVAGGALVRRQLFHRLVGKDAKVTLGGLALLDGARRGDTTLQVVHAAKAGTSREYYRAIVDDDAIGIFQGKAVVEKAAQKTDGAMKSQAVLLSPRAQMNAKPELEIFADDVVCGHGATVASLDPEQLFYLMTRGIGNDEAVSMLLEAFGVEAIDRVEDETLERVLLRPFVDWLARKRAARLRREGEAVSMESDS